MRDYFDQNKLSSQQSFSALNFLDSEAKCSKDEDDDNYPGFSGEEEEQELVIYKPKKGLHDEDEFE
jgi:hypothetical protein